MPNEVSAPLRSIIERLASANIEGPAAKLKKRFVDASNEIVVLADCSGSMEDLIGSQDISKFRHLQIALEDVLRVWPRIRLVAFASYAKQVSGAEQLPLPGGGTNLTGALELAAKWNPRKTIVISDGLPDNEFTALEASQRITGAVDTIYCGPDAHPAVEFLRSLSHGTGGAHFVWDGMKTEISSTIRGLLPAPE